MKLKPQTIFLIIFFFAYFAVRLFFALQTDAFTSDSSYFALREIKHVSETGKLLINDNLSYGGRTFVFMPLYYYIFALVIKFLPGIAVIKIVNNLFASTIIFALYLVCLKLTKNRNISLLTSTAAAFIPIYVKETINNISVFSLIIPGGFFLLYYFLSLEDNKSNLRILLPLTLVLVLCSTSIFFVLFGILLFIIISYIENLPLRRIELEYSFFFLFFFLWASFIIYKSAFQILGFSIIWENTPLSIVSQYFHEINILQALASIGVLPFIFGIYTIYNYLLKRKNKVAFLFISFFLSTFILFWLKMSQADITLIFLSTILFVLFSIFMKDFIIYLKKTKAAKHSGKIIATIVVILLITQVGPGLLMMKTNTEQTKYLDYSKGFSWIKSLPENSVILSIPEEGNLITYFGERKNVIDTQYLLVDDANIRLIDVEKVYTSRFRVELLTVLEKYNVDYVILSNRTKEKYNVSALPNMECFDVAYDEDITIYKWDKEACSLKIL